MKPTQVEVPSSLGREKMQLEILGAFLKPKVLALFMSSTAIAMTSTVLAIGFAGLTIHGLQLSAEKQEQYSIPRIEEHIDNDDHRIDDIIKRLDKIDDAIKGLQQYQSYLSGGGAIIGLLLTLGVLKLNSTDKRVSEQRSRLNDEEIKQILDRYLQNHPLTSSKPRRR